ncbi:MAG: DNA-3-methyladenine glycosylase 2 family protein [Faecalibacterium prausnitzii]|nr:DNA-3-methyladenine glycosylase 2 family protein [Faecalibacterium prausnitzii]
MNWITQPIQIEDDFDLDKILDSGQCFRPCRVQSGEYRFITGSQLLYLRPLGEGEYQAKCAPGEWERTWRPYFDLERSYGSLRRRWAGQAGFAQQALDYGQGIRVLRQDPWEMLITFILSQRKSIPAIRTGVELLAERFGQVVDTGTERVSLFPSPAQLAAAAESDLRDCGLGYRTRYIQHAAQAVASGALDLKSLALLPDETLLAKLMEMDGVGKKVANCVALFGYGRTALAPIDVWIARLIQEDFDGQDPFPQYGAEAGILQQYFFYYKRNG